MFGLNEGRFCWGCFFCCSNVSSLPLMFFSGGGWTILPRTFTSLFGLRWGGELFRLLVFFYAVQFPIPFHHSSIIRICDKRVLPCLYRLVHPSRWIILLGWLRDIASFHWVLYPGSMMKSFASILLYNPLTMSSLLNKSMLLHLQPDWALNLSNTLFRNLLSSVEGSVYGLVAYLRLFVSSFPML